MNAKQDGGATGLFRQIRAVLKSYYFYLTLASIYSFSVFMINPVSNIEITLLWSPILLVPAAYYYLTTKSEAPRPLSRIIPEYIFAIVPFAVFSVMGGMVLGFVAYLGVKVFALFP